MNKFNDRFMQMKALYPLAMLMIIIFGDDYIIKEWAYKKKTSRNYMVTSWED